MQIVRDHVGVAEVAPMVVRPALDRFVLYYTDDILVRKHHHRLQAQCIRSGCLPELATNPKRLQYSEFVPDILVALQLHRNWRGAHLWELYPDLFCLTRSRDTAAGVSHPPRSRNFAGWIVIPYQILAGSCIAPWVRYNVLSSNYVINILELHPTTPHIILYYSTPSYRYETSKGNHALY